MSEILQELVHIVTVIAGAIEKNEDPDPQLYNIFFQHPEYAFQLVDLINNLEDTPVQEDPPLYSASIFALDICVAQLQAAKEGKNKAIEKILTQLMDHLAQTINTHQHSLGFWLPILNAFYEVHVELSDSLKNAYFELANSEEYSENENDTPAAHLNSIRDLIEELADLSVFDIAENFFAQSYAMPPDFFADLVTDLYSIEEGQDIALLTLLHPKAEVREIIVATLSQLMSQVTLSSISLSRLETIKHWYPKDYHNEFNTWIKIQRKKGVVFAPEPEPASMVIKATEVDGSGAQGLFIHARKNRKNRLSGVLLKYELGVKDAWITPIIPASEVAEYYQQAFEESVTLREVDLAYLQMMVEHFLDITIKQGGMVDLHFLEIQELIGVRFRPNAIDLPHLFEELSVQIHPFTQDTIAESLKRSKSWLKNKRFTESWYVENPLVDKIVNHNCTFIEGIRICRLETAMEEVFLKELECHREQWQFHFLWVALWFKAKEKKTEKTWRDSFLIAYLINDGKPLIDIPVMQEVCRQTVINSVETMQERKSHLNKE